MQDDPRDIVRIEDAQRVRVITLNRPEKLNAFNPPLIHAFHDALVGAAADDSVHVVLLTGAGRAFTVGADLNDMSRSASSPDELPDGSDQRFDQLLAAAESFAKPLVAAVNGLAVGLGFTFLGYCDFSFLAESARLRTPFSQLGLSPEAASSYIFPLRMGWSAAARALMLGDWFTAREVVDCGLGHEVVPDSELLEVALGFASRLAQCPLQSLTATKSLMLHAHRLHLAEMRKLEQESLKSLVGSPANLEALEAFAASRTAVRREA